MGERGRGVKRLSSKVSVASGSKVQKRNGDDVDSLFGEGDTRRSSRANRRTLASMLQQEANGKKLFSNSTQPCEMQASPSGLKGPSATCHWGKCAFTKDALNFSSKIGF